METFDLKAEILKEHSKAQCDRIVEWVGSNQQHFDKLFNLFLNGEYRVTQRAAWPLAYCISQHPELIHKRFGDLVKNLSNPGLHDAVKRNSVRILQRIDIPKKYQGEVMNMCFQYLETPQEAVAIKAFSLTVLGNLAKLYPEIVPEIKLLIEEQLASQTPAFISRAKKFLNEVDRL